MDKASFLEEIKTIGTCEDEVQRRDLLSKLSDEVSEVFDNAESLSKTNASLTEDNEALRKANMNLFLRIGEDREPDFTPTKDPEPAKRKFEDLFNEKGDLK